MPEGLLSQVTSRKGAKKLQQADNWILQGLGGLLDAGYAAYDYDYPDTAKGWGGLLAAVADAGAKGLEGTIKDAATDAQDQAYGRSKGKKVTDLALGLLGTNALVPFRAPRGSLPANVWQGSPHKYGPEGARESLKHIGKGEGAQAYGWGRYDAGAREVGEQYRTALSGEHSFKTADGKILRPSEAPDEVTRAAWEAISSMPPEKGLAWLRTTEQYDAAKIAQKVVDAGGESFFDKSSSYLYKHDLPDEDIARYLDWDAPLSEQPEAVRNALNDISARAQSIDTELSDIKSRQVKAITSGDYKLAGRLGKQWTALNQERGVLTVPKDMSMTGKDFYLNIQRGRALPEGGHTPRLSDKEVSEALARAGIPGLKYYDGMSRNPPTMKDVFVDGRKATFAEESVIRNLGNFGGWEGVEGLLKNGQADRIGLTKSAGDEILKNLDKLKAAEREFRKPVRTRNYVTWDQDVLNRMKLLERNGEPMGLLDTVK